MWPDTPTNAAVNSGEKLAFSHSQNVITPANAAVTISPINSTMLNMRTCPCLSFVMKLTTPPRMASRNTQEYVSSEYDVGSFSIIRNFQA